MLLRPDLSTFQFGEQIDGTSQKAACVGDTVEVRQLFAAVHLGDKIIRQQSALHFGQGPRCRIVTANDLLQQGPEM